MANSSDISYSKVCKQSERASSYSTDTTELNLQSFSVCIYTQNYMSVAMPTSNIHHDSTFLEFVHCTTVDIEHSAMAFN